jgi:hypothetical protein
MQPAQRTAIQERKRLGLPPLKNTRRKSGPHARPRPPLSTTRCDHALDPRNPVASTIDHEWFWCPDCGLVKKRTDQDTQWALFERMIWTSARRSSVAELGLQAEPLESSEVAKSDFLRLSLEGELDLASCA